jgi:hypothetical protein
MFLNNALDYTLSFKKIQTSLQNPNLIFKGPFWFSLLIYAGLLITSPAMTPSEILYMIAEGVMAVSTKNTHFGM